MKLFSDNARYSDYGDAPNHHAALRWRPYPEEPEHYDCCALNSESPSDQVWLGSGDEWYHFYNGREFRRMAAWVLWRWVWHDWFGLKTKLWLVGLSLSVSENRNAR